MTEGKGTAVNFVDYLKFDVFEGSRIPVLMLIIVHELRSVSESLQQW